MFTLLALLFGLIGVVFWFPLVLVIIGIWIICSVIKKKRDGDCRDCRNYKPNKK